MKKIDVNGELFSMLLQDDLSENFKKRIDERGLFCYEVSEQERNACLLKCIRAIVEGDLVKAGAHRQEQWEKGWGENLEALNAMETENLSEADILSAIIPKYFGKHDYCRLGENFVRVGSEGYEREILSVLVEWVYEKFLNECDNIYEFGCGTGQNLLTLRSVNNSATLYGLDWVESSQEIINIWGKEKNVHTHRFDYFHPDYDFQLQPPPAKNGVLTVASLEQVGDKYKDFIDYLMANKPYICVHIEPMGEILDEDDLMGYLSIKYFEKRNYLYKFSDYIKKLEEDGKAKVLFIQRTRVGGLYGEGTSVIVWVPIS